MDEFDFEGAAWIILQVRPQHALISPDGHKLYVNIGGELAYYTGKNFGAMSHEEITRYLQRMRSQQ